MFLLILLSPLLLLLVAVVRALMLALPIMIGLHFLHDFIPLVPQLGFWGSFWLSLVAFLVFGNLTTSDD